MMYFNLNGMMSIWMVGILLMLLIAYLVSIDANSVGENGTLWFFIVLLMPMMGLFVYLVVRSINRNPNTRANSNYNYPNSTAPTPPIQESISSRRSISINELELSKSGKQDLADFQFCTSCGFQNNLEASYCKSCGIKLI